MGRLDVDTFDQVLQEYAGDHPFEELDHAKVMVRAWQETGGAGHLAAVHRWADAVKAREPVGGFWPTTARFLRATGWPRRR